jgi:alkylation response protein AidB-like acyl-CoA dehydrogenase
MDFGLSEDQLLLEDTIKRFLAERCPTTRVREIMESPSGHDPKLWKDLADLGVAGLLVPESHGGLGHELLDLALVAEELGYAAAPGPFLGSAMATVALVESDDEGQRERWLPRLASGEIVATLALGEDGAEWDPARIKASVTHGHLKGRKPLVPAAENADLILVAAHDEGGPGLWLVERSSPGLEITPQKGNDMTRRLDAVSFRNVAASKLAGGAAALARAIDAGCVLVAADAYGGSRRCLEMARDYALQREQFGQIIGSFQAVKHQLANMATELEPSLSLLWYAAHAFDHIEDEAARHAAMVKAHMTDLYDRITRDATELHGGIGFTWEFDLHLWFRRAIFDRSFLGEANYHRQRAADLAGW